MNRPRPPSSSAAAPLRLSMADLGFADGAEPLDGAALARPPGTRPKATTGSPDRAGGTVAVAGPAPSRWHTVVDDLVAARAAIRRSWWLIAGGGAVVVMLAYAALTI